MNYLFPSVKFPPLKLLIRYDMKLEFTTTFIFAIKGELLHVTEESYYCVSFFIIGIYTPGIFSTALVSQHVNRPTN